MDMPAAAGSSPRAWRRIASETIADYEVFRVRKETLESPRTGEEFDFHVLDLPDWVAVIGATSDGELILVEQVRHGTGEATLEFPSGTMEEDEDPRDAARRELEEETGYIADEYRVIAEFRPNPALESNRMYVVEAIGARPDGERKLDDGEDVEVRLLGRDEVERLIDDGTIDHAMAIVAWHFHLRRSRR